MENSTLIDALDLHPPVIRLNRAPSKLSFSQNIQVQTARHTGLTTTLTSKPVSIVTPTPVSVSVRVEDPTSPAAPHTLMEVTEVTEVKEVNEVTSYQCALCQETFKEAHLFSAHLKDHLRKNVKGNASNFNTEKYFSGVMKKQAKQRKPKCSLCGLLLSSQASLKRHMYSHFPDRKPCVCPDVMCHRKFTQTTGKYQIYHYYTVEHLIFASLNFQEFWHLFLNFKPFLMKCHEICVNVQSM